MHSEKLSQEAGWFVNTHDLVDRRPDDPPDAPDPKPKPKPRLLLVGGVGILAAISLLGAFVGCLWSL